MKRPQQTESKKNAPKNADEKRTKKPLKLAKESELLMVCGGGVVVECQF